MAALPSLLAVWHPGRAAKTQPVVAHTTPAQDETQQTQATQNTNAKETQGTDTQKHRTSRAAAAAERLMGTIDGGEIGVRRAAELARHNFNSSLRGSARAVFSNTTTSTTSTTAPASSSSTTTTTTAAVPFRGESIPASASALGGFQQQQQQQQQHRQNIEMRTSFEELEEPYVQNRASASASASAATTQTNRRRPAGNDTSSDSEFVPSAGSSEGDNMDDDSDYFTPSSAADGGAERRRDAGVAGAAAGAGMLDGEEGDINDSVPLPAAIGFGKRTLLDASRLQMRLSPGDPFAPKILSSAFDETLCGVVVRIPRRQVNSVAALPSARKRDQRATPPNQVRAEIVGAVLGGFEFKDLCDFAFNIGVTDEHPELQTAALVEGGSTGELKRLQLGLVRAMRAVPQLSGENEDEHEDHVGDDASNARADWPTMVPPPLFARAVPKASYAGFRNLHETTDKTKKFNWSSTRVSRKRLAAGTGDAVGLRQSAESTCASVSFATLCDFRADPTGMNPVPSRPDTKAAAEKCVDPDLLARATSLFNSRPIWTTRAVCAVLRRSQPLTFAPVPGRGGGRAFVVGRLDVDEIVLKRDVFPRICYKIKGGPWRSCWIRLGYDPTSYENSGYGSTFVSECDDGFVCLSEIRSRNLQVLDVRSRRKQRSSLQPQSDRDPLNEAHQIAQQLRAESIAANTVHISADIQGGLDQPPAALVAAQLATEGGSIDNLPGWQCDPENLAETYQIPPEQAMRVLQLCDVIAGDRATFGQFQDSAVGASGDTGHMIEFDAMSGWLTADEREQINVALKQKFKETGSSGRDPHKRTNTTSSKPANSDKRPRVQADDLPALEAIGIEESGMAE